MKKILSVSQEIRSNESKSEQKGPLQLYIQVAADQKSPREGAVAVSPDSQPGLNAPEPSPNEGRDVAAASNSRPEGSPPPEVVVTVSPSSSPRGAADVEAPIPRQNNPWAAVAAFDGGVLDAPSCTPEGERVGAACGVTSGGVFAGLGAGFLAHPDSIETGVGGAAFLLALGIVIMTASCCLFLWCSSRR